MRMSDNNQAHVSRTPTRTLECADDSIRTSPHASINDNDTLADQEETLDHIQWGVMNRNYRSEHIHSDLSFVILGLMSARGVVERDHSSMAGAHAAMSKKRPFLPSTIPIDFLTSLTHCLLGKG